MTPISEFVYRRRVQYNETDASGMVHFSSFFVFAEEAEHAMWRAVGLSVEPGHTEIGWPRVSASFEFFKALRFEDELDIRIRIVGPRRPSTTRRLWNGVGKWRPSGASPASASARSLASR